jgi:hypothetical protein
MKNALQRFFLGFALVCAVNFAIVVLAACSQDPLFLDISREYPPIKPVIDGPASQIVQLGNTLYVTNTNEIWSLNVSSLSGGVNWTSMGNPLGSDRLIKTLAATATDLYALDYDSRLYRHSGGGWTEISSVSGAQQIYGAGATLFIGNGKSVFAYNGNSPTTLSSAGGLLTGAVYVNNVPYISTTKMQDNDVTGIYRVSGSVCTPVYQGSVKGIIATGTAIHAVHDSGGVSSMDGGTTWTITWGGSFYFSGAMAFWPTASNPTMLLVGLMYSNASAGIGYRELDIASGAPAGPYIPGDNSNGRQTSISPDKREISAIRKHPVNSLWAGVPGASRDGTRPIIFASTQQNGVWSYRTRRGDPQWNGEDNSGF